jgi:hypothetical protein
LVEEWGDVKARARKRNRKIRTGMIFQICVDKDSGKEKPEHFRKYKGRVVFHGNDVRGENWDVAMFQELGSAAATMVAGKVCDLFGLIDDHVIEQADATQAHTRTVFAW